MKRLGMWLAAAAVVCSGCGDDAGARYKAGGTVLYQGNPVEGAHVMFTPVNGRSADATTNAQGKFKLSTQGSEDGAIAGVHRVTITKKVPKDPADPYSPVSDGLPARYGSATTSGISKEVAKSGTNDFTLELTD